MCEEKRRLTSVGNHDLDILHAVRAIDADLLVEDEPLVKVRVGELAALLLDDLDVVEVGRALQAEDGVDGEFGKVVLVGREDLGREGCPRNREQVLPELILVLAVDSGRSGSVMIRTGQQASRGGGRTRGPRQPSRAPREPPC